MDNQCSRRRLECIFSDFRGPSEVSYIDPVPGHLLLSNQWVLGYSNSNACAMLIFVVVRYMHNTMQLHCRTLIAGAIEADTDGAGVDNLYAAVTK